MKLNTVAVKSHGGPVPIFKLFYIKKGKIMKRIGAVILLLTFVCCSFTACAQSLESTVEEQTTLTESK